MKIVWNKQTPFSREGLERNIYLLLEGLNAGTIGSAPHLSMDGYRRIRTLPNGRIDLLSVDESTRSAANTIANFVSEMQRPEPEEADADSDADGDEAPAGSPIGSTPSE